MSSQKEQLGKPRRVKHQYENYGHKLYEEGMRQAKIKQDTIKQLAEQMKIKEQKEATFKPKLSQETLKIIERRKSIMKCDQGMPTERSNCDSYASIFRASDTSVREQNEFKTPGEFHNPDSNRESQGFQQLDEFLQRMMLSEKRSERKREKISEVIKKEQDKDCTFKPDINKNSDKLLQEKKMRRSRDHHEELYKEAEYRRAKREEQCNHSLPKEATFHPQIEHQSYINPQLYSDRRRFFDRLVNSRRESEKNLQKLREQYMAPIDPETGQEFFKPVINASTSKYAKQRYSSGLDVHEELYQNREDKEFHKKLLIEQHKLHLNELANQAHVSQNSARLLEYAKIKKLSEIFSYFDYDDDGYIDIEACINIMKESVHFDNELTREIKLAFAECNGKGMDFEQFCDVMLDRCSSGSTEKGVPKFTILFSFSQKRLSKRMASFLEPRLQLRDCTFRPKLNPKSEQIAKQVRKLATEESVPYENLLIKERDKWENHILQLRSLKEKQEISECTFKPNLSKSTSTFSQTFDINAEELISRLSSKPRRIPTNNELITSEEKEFLTHCTFAPKINKSSSTSRSNRIQNGSERSRSAPRMYSDRSEKDFTITVS